MGQRLGVSRNLVSMMEKTEGGRAPSRSVKLLFDDLWAKSMPPERSDSVGTLPPSSVREEPPSYGGARARLKAARLAKGLSVEDFCKATGYSKLIYLGIEDGSSNMSRKMAERVAKVLDIPVEDLLWITLPPGSDIQSTCQAIANVWAHRSGLPWVRVESWRGTQRLGQGTVREGQIVRP